MSFMVKMRRNINFALLSLFWIRHFKGISIYLKNRLNCKHSMQTPFVSQIPSLEKFHISNSCTKWSNYFHYISLLNSEKKKNSSELVGSKYLPFQQLLQDIILMHFSRSLLSSSKMSDLETFVYIPYLKGTFLSSQCN